MYGHIFGQRGQHKPFYLSCCCCSLREYTELVDAWMDDPVGYDVC